MILASSLNKYNLEHCLTFEIMLYILLKHQQFTVASPGYAPRHCQTSCLCVICLDSLPSQSLSTVLTKKHARNVNETASMTNHIDKNSTKTRWWKHALQLFGCHGNRRHRLAQCKWSLTVQKRHFDVNCVSPFMCLCWKWAGSRQQQEDNGRVQR